MQAVHAERPGEPRFAAHTTVQAGPHVAGQAIGLDPIRKPCQVKTRNLQRHLTRARHPAVQLPSEARNREIDGGVSCQQTAPARVKLDRLQHQGRRQRRARQPTVAVVQGQGEGDIHMRRVEHRTGVLVQGLASHQQQLPLGQCEAKPEQYGQDESDRHQDSHPPWGCRPLGLLFRCAAAPAGQSVFQRFQTLHYWSPAR